MSRKERGGGGDGSKGGGEDRELEGGAKGDDFVGGKLRTFGLVGHLGWDPVTLRKKGQRKTCRRGRISPAEQRTGGCDRWGPSVGVTSGGSLFRRGDIMWGGVRKKRRRRLRVYVV